MKAARARLTNIKPLSRRTFSWNAVTPIKSSRTIIAITIVLIELPIDLGSLFILGSGKALCEEASIMDR